MHRLLPICLGLLFGLAPVVSAGDYETKLRFDGKPKSELKLLAAAYFADVLESHEEVAHELEAIEHPARENAGGRYGRGDAEAIEWFSEGTIDPSDDGETFVREEKYYFVIRIPLMEGFRRGWEQRTNAIALVDVAVVEHGVYETGEITRTDIVMRFDGFSETVPTGIDREN